MDNQKKRTYTEQERQETLSTVKERGVCAAAREHGVSQGNVSKWAKAAGVKRASVARPAGELATEPQPPAAPKRGEPVEPEQGPRPDC